MGVQVWRPLHDKQLLVGVLRHGYGQWGLILRDRGLGLISVVQLELSVYILPEAVGAMQALPFNSMAVLADSNEAGELAQHLC